VYSYEHPITILVGIQEYMCLNTGMAISTGEQDIILPLALGPSSGPALGWEYIARDCNFGPKNQLAKSACKGARAKQQITATRASA
jgi:hypothetical protein